MPRTPGQAADRVAEEVQQRIERQATLAAEAILHSLYAPQVVSPPKSQMLDYWRPFFFTPDGYVNQPGRDQVVQMVGGPEYKRIAMDLAREMRREDRDALEQEPTAETAETAETPPLEPPPLEAGVPPLFGPRTMPAMPEEGYST